jgi:hypothetical protein
MVYVPIAVRAGKRDLGVGAALAMPHTTSTVARIPVKYFIYSYLLLINIIILYNASYLKDERRQ